MATFFEAALLRLKGALQVTTDKEVAELLGMSPNALNERKRRDSFPEDRVRALAAKLHFDPEYVIGGVAQAALEVIDAAREGKPMKKVSAEDAALLARWHQCTQADQLLLMSLLRRLEGAPPNLEADGRYPHSEEAAPRTLHDRAPRKGG
jgi:transcriptional regulator with XRE-family HTH domain